MLTEVQLTALLADLEADNVERTQSTTDTAKFCQAVCAFANDLPGRQQPGYLLIGVDDQGNLAGIQVTDELLRNLGGIRADGNVLPTPAIHVEKFSLAGGEVAVVEVLPSDLPPVIYKGRCWIRVGPRKAVASPQEEKILTERRQALARSFDALPCSGAGLDELDAMLFEGYRRSAVNAETIQENQRSLEEQLAALRFYSPKRSCPTFAGILLFGRNPRFFLPGAYIQYLQLPATELTDTPVDQAEISGDLVSVLRELHARSRLSIHTVLQSSDDFQERLVPDYPEVALREFLTNAVLHRNYESNAPIRFYAFSDRIEIQSPGGLHGEASPENFPRQNSYRNPILAEALKTLGYVNRFGYGVQRAQRMLKENGNPEPEFVFDPHAVLVKVYRRQS
ncbi:putative DNA binding domain-containing protein [bacterium]|nr:putative DNA binding domain-containing protein [bacterium]